MRLQEAESGMATVSFAQSRKANKAKETSEIAELLAEEGLTAPDAKAQQTALNELTALTARPAADDRYLN